MFTVWEGLAQWMQTPNYSCGSILRNTVSSMSFFTFMSIQKFQTQVTWLACLTTLKLASLGGTVSCGNKTSFVSFHKNLTFERETDPEIEKEL